MPSHSQFDDPTIDVDSLILIVVGAHPRAELLDRPIAYGLRERIAAWLNKRFGEHSPLMPLVVTDVWYLNDTSLKSCPTICIGGPGANALSAYLGDKVPSAFCIDEQLMVQLDLEFDDLIACCWGVNTRTNGAAVQAFEQRYMDQFLDAACREMAAE